MEKYENFTETRFHELERVSKMRLLQTHSHTSERRDYEAGYIQFLAAALFTAFCAFAFI